MTTSFTSSSSSFDSTLLLCLIFAFFITPSSSNYLSDMCIKSKSPRFCLQVFGLNPHRRPYQLTREAINLALTNASDITKKIHTFIDQTEDFNLKDIYSYCLNYYQSVIDTLRSAEERLLNDGGYADVNDAGIIAQVNAFRCENEFQRELGYVYNSTLTKDNENLRIFGSILVSSINLLYNSTSVQKGSS
ncbi:putative zinc finger A20 and AN1 domain-containing stress-associated protein 8-like isoform X2 [Capsicum annuum]|nr:putative zinc finger A20 and AN1 domain-containing stress-associated protein 8-like isoform X2 [Capsicum annuum]KAF3665222.1 putative zinc finger A20 and AN1 domain-containing stress-associated protein 8-like isoform X2 [Capsicum annuum]